MNDIGSDKKVTKARIDPKYRVADEDYFRGIKDRKLMAGMQKASNEKTIARTRFDEQDKAPVGVKSAALADQDEKEEIELAAAACYKTLNPHTIMYIDPHDDPMEAISRIQLPAKTMYLIDKVVRAKALQGPIGVDNSEVINLEQEKELKARGKYLANLAAQRKQGTGDSDEDEERDSDEEEAVMND